MFSNSFSAENISFQFRNKTVIAILSKQPLGIKGVKSDIYRTNGLENSCKNNYKKVNNIFSASSKISFNEVCFYRFMRYMNIYIYMYKCSVGVEKIV